MRRALLRRGGKGGGVLLVLRGVAPGLPRARQEGTAEARGEGGGCSGVWRLGCRVLRRSILQSALHPWALRPVHECMMERAKRAPHRRRGAGCDPWALHPSALAATRFRRQ